MQNLNVKMSSICMRIKNHLHINSFALSLALKQRLETTWNGLLMTHTQDTQCNIYSLQQFLIANKHYIVTTWIGFLNGFDKTAGKIRLKILPITATPGIFAAWINEPFFSLNTSKKTRKATSKINWLSYLWWKTEKLTGNIAFTTEHVLYYYFFNFSSYF